MKKLIIIILLIPPVVVRSQSAWTLKHQADSLNAIQKPEQALKLYDQAINRITNYQDTVSQLQWFKLCTAAGELAGDDYMKYSPARYFVGGEKFNEKIAALKKQGSNCIFTYNTFNPSVGASYIIDPKKKFQFIPSTNKLLIWVIDDNLYMQAFGNNIFKPLKMENQPLVAFLKANHDKLPTEEIGRQRFNYTDGNACAFNFYWGDKIYKKEIDDPTHLRDPHKNDNTYLGKLLPLVQAEVKKYYATLKYSQSHF